MDKKAWIDGLVRAAREKGIFTGTWLYAENGQIVSEGALGFRDPEDLLPMREDCVFDLASVSKNFTAAAIMLLRRRGRLDLEDDIRTFFPKIPYQGVTIRHLLNHTGGLPDYMDWVDQTAKAENTIPGNDVIVRFLCECGEDACFAPGEKWEYSNTGYCLLAQIAEKVSGEPFEDFLLKNVFGPAGMTATKVYHRRKDGITIPNLAYGMVLSPGADRYTLADDDADSGEVITCDGMNGDGLVHSNIRDLYMWDRALREEKVLTKEEQNMMYTPGRLNSGAVSGDESDEDGSAYGFGWFTEDDPALGRILSHSGGWPGYNTFYRRFADVDRVLVILCCRDSTDQRAYDAFVNGLKAVSTDEEPAPVRTIEELAPAAYDTSDCAAYLGKYDYQIGRFRIDEIFMKDGHMYARASWKDTPRELRLYPLGENTFGIKDTDGDIAFGDGCISYAGVTGKKL